MCAQGTALRRRAQWTNAADAAGPGCLADSRQNVNAKTKGAAMMPTRMRSSRSGKENSATSWTTNTSNEVTPGMAIQNASQRGKATRPDATVAATRNPAPCNS